MKALELKVPPPIVALTVGLLMWFLARIGPRVAVPAPARAVVALALVALGVAVGAAGAIAFRRARTTVSPTAPETTTALVSSGIYAVTRNPMYVGLLLFALAWAVYLASPLSLLGPAALWLYLDRFQIAREEGALSKLVGSAYAAYATRVHRWL